MRTRLGQHFLKNKDAAEAVAAAAFLEAGDIVIEIGPGKAALTNPLVQRCEAVGAVFVGLERDEEIARTFAHHSFSVLNNVSEILFSGKEILIGDALETLPALVQKLGTRRYVVVGNIPYYITGILLRRLSELSPRPAETVLMIQKEVALRLAAQPPEMNLLAAAVQFWADPLVLFTLKPGDFSPAPKVDSAVVHLKIKNTALSQNSEKYYPLIRAAFAHPRKTLLNNLEPFFSSKAEALLFLNQLEMTEKTRPGELSVEQFLLISAQIKQGS